MGVDTDDPRVPRVQIADSVREKIHNGSLVVGSRLKSVRDLAIEYEVSLNTAQAAVDILKAEGLVAAYGNRGIFVEELAPIAPEPAAAHYGAAIAARIGALADVFHTAAELLRELEAEVRGAAD